MDSPKKDANKYQSLDDYSIGRRSGDGWGGVRFLFGLNIALGLMLMAFEVPVASKAINEISPPEDMLVTLEMPPPTVQKKKAIQALPPEMKPKETIVSGPIVEVNNLYETATFELQAMDEDVYAGIDFEDGGDEDILIERDPEPTVFYEQAPEFPGGLEAFYKFLVREIDYPTQATWNAESGKTHVSFVINLDGSVTDIAIVGKGISPSIDREIVRALALSPDWTPGSIKGKPVPIRYTIPMTFQLD